MPLNQSQVNPVFAGNLAQPARRGFDSVAISGHGLASRRQARRCGAGASFAAAGRRRGRRALCGRAFALCHNIRQRSVLMGHNGALSLWHANPFFRIPEPGASISIVALSVAISAIGFRPLLTASPSCLSQRSERALFHRVAHFRQAIDKSYASSNLLKEPA